PLALQAHRHQRVGAMAMRGDIALGPGAKAWVDGNAPSGRRRLLEGRIHEVAGDALELRFADRIGPAAQMSPVGVDFAGEGFSAQRLDQDLDARLEDVVAATQAIIGPQDRFAVIEELAPVEVALDDGGELRRAPLPA